MAMPKGADGINVAQMARKRDLRSGSGIVASIIDNYRQLSG
jgi:hypothetical protein